MSTTDTPFVTLKGGTIVDLEALRLAWKLEAQGLRLSVSDGRLTVGPRTAITPADDALIRQHRDALVTVVAYAEHITA